MSLRLRLALVVASTFAAVVVACVYAAHVSARNQLRAETDRFLTQRVSDPHFDDDDHDFRPPPQSTEASQPFVNPGAVVQLISSDGTVQSQPIAGQPELPVNAH